jgi:hypothetical protein
VLRDVCWVPYLQGMDGLQKRRNSRWDRNPLVGADGRPVIARITERDLDILKLLARYRYLPADDIHAFIGGSFKNVLHRLNLLSRKPNLFINRPHQQRQTADTNYRRLIYELDDNGIATLQERNVPHLSKSYHRHFAHELMVCRIAASIELGIRADQSLRLITWPEILANKVTPAATRESSTPASIPVTSSLHNQTCSLLLTADDRPFGIVRTDNSKKAYMFFPGIEADCGTEPIDASDFERSSINKKFVAYRAVVTQGLHRTHFGFPNFLVPFITTNKTRMESMMKHLERITDERRSKMFLFATFPAFTAFEQPPAAGGHMLTREWLRVGYPPITIPQILTGGD